MDRRGDGLYVGEDYGAYHVLGGNQFGLDL